MGSFSPQHWILFTFLIFLFFINLAMIVHIVSSPRSSRLKKVVFVTAQILIPFLPYFLWLALRDSTSNKTLHSRKNQYTAAYKVYDNNHNINYRDDEEFYKVAQNELQEKSNGYRDSLWIKCKVENHCHEKAAYIAYIKYRARELRQQAMSSVQEIEVSHNNSDEFVYDINVYLSNEFPKITDEDRAKARRVSPTSEIEKLFKVLEHPTSNIEDLLREKPYLTVATARNGESLLMKAVSLERKDLCHLLISKGADPHAMNRWGYSPYILALKKQWEWFIDRYKND